MGISLNGLNSGLGDTYSSLLGGMSSGSSDLLGGSTLLSDYASIKNGSYGKLMKSYYAKLAKEEDDSSSSSSSSSGTKKTNVKDSLSASAATTAQKAADKLSGMTMSEENKDEVYDAVSSFIKGYNDMMKNASKSENASVKRQADNLNDAMYTNFKLFAQIGITLNDDRTLSLNEDTFKKSNIGTVKALFSGIGSFADKVSSKASQIHRYADSGNDSTAKSYTKKGTYTKTNTDSTIDSTL